MYESGETSYLDVLLTSKSITDFLAKYYYASELVDCDKQLIQTTKDQKTQIEAEKAELEASKRELDTTLAQAEQKNVELKSLKKEKETYVQQLSEEEKKVQKEIEELEEANKQIQKEITAARIRYQKQLAELKRQQEAKKNNNKNNNNNSSNGGSTTGSGYFIRPVSSGTVTTNGYYSTGKFHGAIDYGVASGTTVMAAADGVVMSTANLSGSYGTYVVIEHANGLQTYYAHGTKGSITVKPGDIVKQGQKIMLSGSTGNSTGPHLHFEVRKSPYNYSYSATDRNKTRNSIPNLLNQIMSIVPESVQITSIENSTGTHVVINAQSNKYEQLGYLKAKIKSDVILTNVISTAGQKDNNVVTVKIEGDLP